MPVNKGAMWPAIFLTPLKYSEIAGEIGRSTKTPFTDRDFGFPVTVRRFPVPEKDFAVLRSQIPC